MALSHDDKPTSLSDFEGTLFGFPGFRWHTRFRCFIHVAPRPPDIEREEEATSPCKLATPAGH